MNPFLDDFHHEKDLDLIPVLTLTKPLPENIPGRFDNILRLTKTDSSLFSALAYHSRNLHVDLLF